jgi:DNA mismatch repair ATPase MutS
MTPNEVYLFKKNKEDILVRAKTGDIYEIFYEDENDEDYEN